MRDVKSLADSYIKENIDNKYIDVLSYKDKLIDIYSYYDNIYVDFSISPGWLDLVFDCHEKLKYISDTYEILQIKQKFGLLRYYTHYNHPSYYNFDRNSFYNFEINVSIFKDIAYYTENKSSQICEISGQKGELRFHKGRYITLCDEEFEKFCNNKKNPI